MHLHVSGISSPATLVIASEADQDENILSFATWWEHLGLWENPSIQLL
jgi:hypothetical protein